MIAFSRRPFKFIVATLLLVFLVVAYVSINHGPIYALTQQTAVFIPEQTVPQGLDSLNAKDCGECHQQIYQEWQTSMHSRAFSSPFFQAYHKKDKYDPSCLVCHTPLQNQLRETISYQDENFYSPIARHNPNYNQVLQSEGVTCSACHVRDGVVLGPYSADQLNSPHPVKYDSKFKSKQICLQCHQVPSKPYALLQYGVCSTGEEFAGSHWEKGGFICQDCHMEKKQRSLVDGFPERETRMHNWPGGYSNEQLRKSFTFSAFRKSEGIVIRITNSGAGHRVPTGDPDRYIDLTFVAVKESGIREELKSVRFKRQIVWQPIMFEFSDNRLAAGESLEFSLPAELEGELWVEGIYHIMTDWSFRRLEENYGLTEAPEIHRAFLKKKIAVENP